LALKQSSILQGSISIVKVTFAPSCYCSFSSQIVQQCYLLGPCLEGLNEESVHSVFHFVFVGIVICWFEVLQTGVQGPCLHRPENWLLRQLIDL
jgi:hypothetical protein